MGRLRADVGEWAFLDLREAGEAADGHPFASCNIPFGRLEIDLAALVPRRDVPVVLFDAGDGVAERAAERMSAAGWGNLAILAGGARAWQEEGLPLIKGEHSYSKAFGEWVQHAFGVPEIGPEELDQRMRAEDAPLLIDGRPLAEHRRFTLPRSVNCPNADLGLRVAADSARPVVVHCAGRTRSIIGAQTLRDFGMVGPVMALRDGTQGWELSGRQREIGADRSLPLPEGDSRDGAAARARRVMERFGLRAIRAAEVARWARDPSRTTYFFDARPEGEGSPPPGFRHAPGTTLVQQTDRFVGTRGARVVLYDPLLVRAVFAALWLDRMGIEAHVLEGDPPPLPQAEAIPLPALPGWVADVPPDAVLLDLRPGAAFRAAHPQGAARGLRARLDRIGLAPASRVVLIPGDAGMARLVAGDLVRAGHRPIGCLPDDPAAWQAAGLAVVTDSPDDPARDIDIVRFCAGRHHGNLADARAYLDWETGLLDRLAAAGLSFWPAASPSEDMNHNRKTAGA